MSDSVVQKWLRFLDVEEYSESFIDNGYDDLETVKLIKREDLEAIGVMRRDHHDYLLASVKVLRERGAAWVYLLYCETTDDTEDKFESDNDYGSSVNIFVDHLIQNHLSLQFINTLMNLCLMNRAVKKTDSNKTISLLSA